MEKFVIKNIERPSADVVEEYKTFDVSTVYEAQYKQGLMQPYLRPIQSGVTIAGPAVTVTCPAGDNLMIHAAVEVCKPGDIVVITTIGDSDSGMIGELIVSALMKKGVAGMIMDAGIRDVKQLRELGFPVWTKAIHSQGTTKHRGGWVNVPTVCAGTIVNPGDLIVADDDGVVVVKKEDVEQTKQLTLNRYKKEEQTKEKIDAGQISIDFYDLRPVLEKENVVYYEDMDAYKAKLK